MRLLDALAGMVAGVLAFAVWVCLWLLAAVACLVGGFFLFGFVIAALAWLAGHSPAAWTAMVHTGTGLGLALLVTILARYGVLFVMAEDATAPHRAAARRAW